MLECIGGMLGPGVRRMEKRRDGGCEADYCSIVMPTTTRPGPPEVTTSLNLSCHLFLSPWQLGETKTRIRNQLDQDDLESVCHQVRGLPRHRDQLPLPGPRHLHTHHGQGAQHAPTVAILTTGSLFSLLKTKLTRRSRENFHLCCEKAWIYIWPSVSEKTMHKYKYLQNKGWPPILLCKFYWCNSELWISS